MVSSRTRVSYSCVCACAEITISSSSVYYNYSPQNVEKLPVETVRVTFGQTCDNYSAVILETIQLELCLAVEHKNFIWLLHLQLVIRRIDFYYTSVSLVCSFIIYFLIESHNACGSKYSEHSNLTLNVVGLHIFVTPAYFNN